MTQPDENSPDYWRNRSNGRDPVRTVLAPGVELVRAPELRQLLQRMRATAADHEKYEQGGGSSDLLTEAADALEELTRPGGWTCEKPTQDGYYWMRRGADDPEIMEIWHGMACEADVSFELDDDRYESALWFGPLTAPPLEG